MRRIFRRSVFITAWFILLPLSLSLAKETCSRLVVCVSVRDEEGLQRFYLQNLKDYDVTVTIEFPTLVNMRASAKLPYTETVSGGQTIRGFDLEKVNPSLKWTYNYRFFWKPGSIHGVHDESYRYRLPYPAGKKYRVAQGFNGKISHTGESQYAIDWTMPEGSPVHAARGGRVIDYQEGFSTGAADPWFKNYGNYIVIEHSDGTLGIYGHILLSGVKVALGQEVEAGDLIAYSGNTGFSSGPHLHFGVYKPVDGKMNKSFPIRFNVAEGNDRVLLEGQSYTSTETDLLRH